MIFAIDFDGTIVRHKFPEIGEIIPDAVEAMRQIKDLGHHIIIWTCRAGDTLKEAIDFLNANNIPYDCVNQNLPWHITHYNNDSRKIFADIYIDDANAGRWTWPEVLAVARGHKANDK